MPNTIRPRSTVMQSGVNRTSRMAMPIRTGRTTTTTTTVGAITGEAITTGQMAMTGQMSSLPEPKEWRLQVAEDGDKITVTFYAYSGHGGNHISRYKDIFRQGSYCHKGRVKEIAAGPGGYEL